MTMRDPCSVLSAFHATPLAKVKGIDTALVSKASELGYTDAEQLLAALKVPGILEHFAQFLSIGYTDALGTSEHLAQISAPHTRPFEPSLSVGIFSMGALEPTPESKAASAFLPSPLSTGIALPGSVNHIGQMKAIRDQGQRGTCVAFGVTAVHELFRSSSQLDLSEQFLYEEMKRIDGHAGGCGTWLSYGLLVLRDLGQCRESEWAYNPNLPCNGNGSEPVNARAQAAAYRVTGHSVGEKDVNAMKSALALGANVAFSIPVYDSWYLSSETARSGRITMRVGNEPVVGGHCMCLVGYQDDGGYPGGGYFILRNSWGNAFWGYQCPYGAGYGTIPYAYLSSDGWEAGTIS